MDIRQGFSRWLEQLCSGIFWQPLHSPVSSLAGNDMFEELNEDICFSDAQVRSLITIKTACWLLKRAPEHNS